MAASTEIAVLIKALLERTNGSRESLAHELGVSLSTLLRWGSGKSVPRPDFEGKLRSLAARRIDPGIGSPGQALLFSPPLPVGEEQLREALLNTLNGMREILHRSGRLSSRHEALDEISKLLFAHVMSVDAGGDGISTNLLACAGGSPVAALRDFVSDIFSRYLPLSLAHELGPGDFQLRIKDSEERFALEVIDCFERYASPRIVPQIRDARSVDVLNDTFGQFLADSFSDEKELGQYLTPIEIVRVMTSLGLDSLDSERRKALLSPEGCTTVGAILDPSCGVASFLSQVLRSLYPIVQEREGLEGAGRWLRNMLRESLVGIDKSERMIKLALTNLALFGVPAVNLHLANALVRRGADSLITDGLRGRATLILTNPPFGAEFSGDDLKHYRLATAWTGRHPQTLDSELLFIERYIDWLAPGGILVAIVPDSILTNKGLYSDLRRGIADVVEILTVVSLPNVTFGVAGTSTKTSILHLRKRSVNLSNRATTYFAVCGDVGFHVSTRSSQRRKVATDHSDLDQILVEAVGNAPPTHGRRALLDPSAERWDATYHAGLTSNLEQTIIDIQTTAVRVRDLARLASDRIDPRRLGTETFKYIEIGDVEARGCTVRHKVVPCREAPSRARKKVRAGDVLVSTVRPERRTVGVVPETLDGAVCSTGFAVLRCTTCHPLLLALLLQTDFAAAQIMRNNVGIAYPAIEEQCLLDIVLPIQLHELAPFREPADRILELRQAADLLEQQLVEKLTRRLLTAEGQTTI